MTMNNAIQALLSQVDSPAVEPGASPNGPWKATASEPLGTLLPEPSMIVAGDIGAEVALLGIKAGRDEQQIDQTTEQDQDQVEDTAEQAEVNEMRTEASDIMSNALAASCMQIGQGEAQIAGAASGASQSELGAYTGTASMYGAGSTFFTARGQSLQQLDQAQVTAFKAVADRAQQTATEATQGETDARSVISNAIQFCQEYEQTKSQIDLAAAGQKA
jgi:hypothetical protein